MAKVFTITEGLENLGAIKTGGQGSVYKGKRIGEIITAIKLLPTPILDESEDDKHYIDFQNEVQKLSKVNENPNPYVVKILSSGISDTGSFPFIEMEYVEGPDLGELLKPPHDLIFTINDIIKVAEQLSNALAHCHGVDVKHGDIKSNNIKYNIHTGNYVLLDFGLAIMSDEQRRTSLRRAGAIEFMAPEQNDGQMLFETDVYSFGVVLYELVAGQVPFPLNDQGETARNAVMVSHMEATPPDMLSLRKQNLPTGWSPEKREMEMKVPAWLTDMIYKCLEKNPKQRFSDGNQLHDFIVLNSTLSSKEEKHTDKYFTRLYDENEKLLEQKKELQQLVTEYEQTSRQKEKEIQRQLTIIKQNENLLEQKNKLQAVVTEYDQTSRQKEKELQHLNVIIAQNEKLLEQKKELEAVVRGYEQASREKEKELQHLHAVIAKNEKQHKVISGNDTISPVIPATVSSTSVHTPGKTISKSAFYALLLLPVLLAVLAVYGLFFNRTSGGSVAGDTLTQWKPDTQTIASGTFCSAKKL